MSFDFLLHKRNLGQRITKSELELMDEDALVVTDIQNDETGDVLSFSVSLKDSPFPTKFDVTLQETGEYWISTYDYEDEDFADFIKIIETLGVNLKLVVDNPQTGETSLPPQGLYNDQMKKFLGIQRKVVGNIPRILKDAGIDSEPIKSDLQLYEENRNKLIEIYENKGYYVDNIMWGSKDGETKYFCSWILSVPTILPPVPQVILLETASEESPAYLINMDQLEKGLGKNILVVMEPCLHYVVNPLNNTENEESLLRLATQLK